MYTYSTSCLDATYRHVRVYMYMYMCTCKAKASLEWSNWYCERVREREKGGEGEQERDGVGERGREGGGKGGKS